MDDVGDIETPGDELRDGSEGEEQDPMEDGQQRDGSVVEHAGHSKRDLETDETSCQFGSSGCEGIDPCVEAQVVHRSWPFKRRDECVVMSVLETCNQNIHVLLSLVKCWISMNGLVRTFLSLPLWEGFTTSVKCLNIVCHGTLFQISYRSGRELEGWQRWARDPKQVVLDQAGENLHDIFLDPLALNSVETEISAAECPWQAGITEANGRAFMMGSRKCWSPRSRKMKDSLKSVSMRLC